VHRGCVNRHYKLQGMRFARPVSRSMSKRAGLIHIWNRLVPTKGHLNTAAVEYSLFEEIIESGFNRPILLRTYIVNWTSCYMYVWIKTLSVTPKTKKRLHGVCGDAETNKYLD
jgi:hypothetical protein